MSSDAPGRPSAGSSRTGFGPKPGGTAAFGQDGAAVGGSVPKIATGITGFDEMTMGGLPRGRTTVLAGQAGSAKTIFAAQFLAEGVRTGHPGVFVTLEEPIKDLRANLTTLGHDIAAWERAGDWAFIDASPQPRLLTPSQDPSRDPAASSDPVAGTPAPGETTRTLPSPAPPAASGGAAVEPYYLQTLLAQISHAVDATAADRLVLDSISAVLALHPDPLTARQSLRALISGVRALGLTIMMTVETPTDPSLSMDTVGLEEFVADNVVLVHNIREGRSRRRTLEVLKMRGAAHFKTESAFVVLPGRGVVILPTSRSPREVATSSTTITSGDDELDSMLGGGLRSGSLTLVAGPTGAGKTLLGSTFAAAAPATGQKALLLAYEESHDQVVLNATGWGQDFPTWQQQGLLQISAFYPDAASLDEHLVEIQDLIDRLRPQRLVLDSVTALARLGTPESYREFTTRLVAHCKQEAIAALVTMASTGIEGVPDPYDAHVAALADAIIILRHDQRAGRRRRALTVLKVRGSGHDEQERPFTINDHGLTLQTAPG